MLFTALLIILSVFWILQAARAGKRKDTEALTLYILVAIACATLLAIKLTGGP